MTKPAQNKEQTILEAAEHEFLTKGYDGARTISIAEAAGVTHAMLHYYFRTKEQLFERILDEKMHLMAHSVITAFGRQGLPLTERICDGIACHFDFVMANPDLPRFIVNEIFARPERYEIMRRRIREIAGELLLNLQREMDESAACGETEPVDARMLMLDIISLNVFSFIAFPIIEPILGDFTTDREAFFRCRREENILIIMKRLKKS